MAGNCVASGTRVPALVLFTSTHVPARARALSPAARREDGAAPSACEEMPAKKEKSLDMSRPSPRTNRTRRVPSAYEEMPAKKEKSLERFSSNDEILSACAPRGLFAAVGAGTDPPKEGAAAYWRRAAQVRTPRNQGGAGPSAAGLALARVRPMSSRPSIRHFLRNGSTSKAAAEHHGAQLYRVFARGAACPIGTG